MLTKLNDLYYHKLKVRFTTSKRIAMHYWFGAVLRNRFLKAADDICDDNGVSLRKLLDTFPLSSEHFMYKRLRGGFPKAFLFRFDDFAPDLDGFVIQPNLIYSFDLIIIGNYCNYVNLFAQAIDKMLNDGFGHPIQPLSLVDICEDGDDGYLYCRGRQMGNLSYPKKISDLCSCGNLSNDRIGLEILLVTPMSLISHPGKVAVDGYQARLNNFPSIYQILRSVCYRLVTLSALYCNSRQFNDFEEIDEAIENYIADVAPSLLISASISWRHCYSTPRKEGETYKMSGYMGRLVFSSVPSRYVPLLHFASALAVGNDVNYALGAYNVRCSSSK